MKKKKPGFTLMEMIIVVTLTVIILAIASSMFITGNKVFSDSDIKSTLQMEGQAIQENISNIGMQGLKIDSCKDKTTSEIKGEKYSDLLINSKLVNINGELSGDKEWIDISQLSIESYGKDSEYDYNSDSVSNHEYPNISCNAVSNSIYKSIYIDSKVLSTNVESIRIRPENIKNLDGTICETNAIGFNIVLAKKKGVSEVSYPINFNITFRNKS